MNICIATVYNSENCGSFLQAYSLMKTLENEGHNVCFLERKTKNTSSAFRVHCKESIKRLLKLRFWDVYGIWKRCFNFKRAVNVFKILNNDVPDCYVIGSDTLWNFDSEYFYINKDIYTGREFKESRVVTYAVSAGNTKRETITEDKEITDAIKALDLISVRDEYTAQIVEQINGVKPEIVCDPTLLVERKDFDVLKSEINDKDYILIYHFGKISGAQKQKILELKKKTGKKLISFGDGIPWCDKNVAYDPHDFLAYFENADFIITNTFHGTIFSVLYEKMFADYGANKQKVKNLLGVLGLDDHICDVNADICKLFDMKPDYVAVNKKINQIRMSSLEYLKKAIEGEDK